MPNRVLTAVFILGALGACSSGGATGTVGRATAAYNIGTQDANASGNGLAFAQSGADQNGGVIASALGNDTATLTLARLRSNAPGTAAVTELVLVSIKRVGAENLLVTIDGQEIELAPRGGTGTGGGMPDFTLDVELPGTNASVYTSSNTLTGSESVSAFVVGHETNPSVISNIAGSASYPIDIAGSGVQTINGADPLALLITGDGTIDVDFSAPNISGGGTINSNIGMETIPDVFTIVDGQIVGNGFTARIKRECPAGSTCTSASKIGGAFFGENAAEIAGIGTIAETQKMDGNVAKIDGVIGFIGAKTPPIR